MTAPARTAAQHQSLLHFIGEGGWSDEQVLAKVRELVLPGIERQGPIEAWIIDDTAFPKQGRHSVGVARQYCGQLGKQDNCQVAVSLSLANRHASLPVAYQLYLPQEWAADPVRRRKAHVPKEIVFHSKPEIALEQLRWACVRGRPAARRGAARCWLWQQQRVAQRDCGARAELCGRYPADHDRMGPWHGTVAAEAVVGSWSTADAASPRCRASAGLGQGACTGPFQALLAHD